MLVEYAGPVAAYSGLQSRAILLCRAVFREGGMEDSKSLSRRRSVGSGLGG